MIKKLSAVLRRFAVFLVMAAGLMSQSSMADLLQDTSRPQSPGETKLWYHEQFYSSGDEARDNCYNFVFQRIGERRCHYRGNYGGTLLFEHGWEGCAGYDRCTYTPRWDSVYLRIFGCLEGYHAVQGPSGQLGCEAIRPQPIEAATCWRDSDGEKGPNPIALHTQEKYRWELDWESHGPSALSIARIYRSNRAFEIDKGSARVGLSWTHNHHWRLKIKHKDDAEKAEIITPEGYSRIFSRALGASAWDPVNSTDKLITQGFNFIYSSADDNENLKFDSSGKLLERNLLHGWKYTYH